MKRTRIKRSPRKVRDKVEKREEQYQGMAIRGIINKNRQEEEKNKVTDRGFTNSISNTNVINQPTQEVEKKTATATDTTGVTEIFDSSKYDSITEIKESANIKEEGHLKDVLSNVEREEPIAPETVDTSKPSNIDINSRPPQQKLSSSTITADGSPPSLEERVAMFRGSKEEVSDQGLESNKNMLQKEVEDNKEKEHEKEAAVGEDYSVSICPKYTTSSWLDLANIWTDLYVQSAKNAATMTEYWLGLFSKPWLGGYKKKDKGKVE